MNEHINTKKYMGSARAFRYLKSLGCLAAILLFTLFSFGICVSAENSQKVVDSADLLDDAQEKKLQERLLGIAEKYQCDVVVATTNSCGGKSPQDYTDDFYYQNGYGYGNDINGIILMVSMKERKFHLATRGKANTVIFTDYGLEQIDEQITGYLSDGEYSKAFLKFADLAEDFIKEAEQGEPFDVGHEYKEPMSIGVRILISVGAGLVAAVLVVVVLFMQLRSVAPKHEAQEYVRNGSFHVTRERDIFLYRTVNRRKIETNTGGGGGGSSSHSTSDGGSAGGHTGSF